MKSLFDQTESRSIIDRINKLKPDTQPQWGKMNVAQMLAHSQQPMKVAIGDLQLKQTIFGKLFGRMFKKKLLNDEPFGMNMPTAKEFMVQPSTNFDEEKNKMIALVERFTKNGLDGVTKLPHPFFGKMTAQEWDKLQWKHLDHHLRQFGV